MSKSPFQVHESEYAEVALDILPHVKSMDKLFQLLADLTVINKSEYYELINYRTQKPYIKRIVG